MSWLRANALNVVVVLALICAISGWTSSARWAGIAETHEERADLEEERADSILEARLAKERADSVRWAAAVDSVAARAARDAERATREAQARERAERARAQAQAAAETLAETLTPAQVPLFEAYRAERDSEVAAVTDELVSTQERVTDLERENVTMFESRESIAELYDDAVEELAAVRASNESRDSANDARRMAARSQGIIPDFGRLTEPLYLVGGIVLGYGLSEITR